MKMNEKVIFLHISHSVLPAIMLISKLIVELVCLYGVCQCVLFPLDVVTYV